MLASHWFDNEGVEKVARNLVAEALRAPAPDRGKALLNAAWASYLSACHRTDDAERVLKTDVHAAQLLKPMIVRADQTVGSTTGSHWASDLVQTSVGGFFSSIQPLSAAARLVALGESVTLGATDSVAFPTADTTPGSTPWIEESKPIGVRSFSFDSDMIGPSRKVSSIVGFSRELWKRGAGGRTIFDRMLREVAAHSLDSAVFGNQAASSAACAGLRNGLTPVTGHGDPESDLVSLLNAVSSLGGGGDVVVVANPQESNVLRIRLPQLNVPVLASRALPVGTIFAIDPTCFASSVSDVEVFASEESVVHMSDVPLEIVSGTGPATADPVRSAFQTGVIMLRLIVDLSFIARGARVAVMEGISWA